MASSTSHSSSTPPLSNVGNDVRDASIALRDAQRAAAEAAAEVRRTTHAARLAGQRANALLVTIRGEL